MKKLIFAILACTAVSGCVTAEQAAANRYANITASCRKMGYSGSGLANCQQNLILMAAEQQRRQDEGWDDIARAGQALQNIH